MIMRLFVAINFNNDTRLRLLALRDELRGKSQRGNFSTAENLHLTLVYLGERDCNQTNAVKSVLGDVKVRQFSVTVDCVGRFKRYSGDIWWTGLQENKPLLTLQRDLTERLTTLGFTLDRRNFSPHITLGREIVTDAKPWKFETFGETVSAIDLMKSERISGNLTYTSIFRHPLN